MTKIKTTLIVASMAIGTLLAIFLDRKVRGEGVLRTVFLYPYAMSFVATGLVWQWLLNPESGLQAAVRTAGWDSFTFDWIVNQDRVIYTIVMATVWQASGLVMALMLAALRVYRPEAWQRLQAAAYGARIQEAAPAAGVDEFFAYCRQHSIPICIVSHKTEYSNLGESCINLRTSAMAWSARFSPVLIRSSSAFSACPMAAAWARPRAVRSEVLVPCMRRSMFQAVSPCRIR